MYPSSAMGASHRGTFSCCWMSLGMSTSTGPGRPVRARKKASLMTRGMSSTSITR